MWVLKTELLRAVGETVSFRKTSYCPKNPSPPLMKTAGTPIWHPVSGPQNRYVCDTLHLERGWLRGPTERLLFWSLWTSHPNGKKLPSPPVQRFLNLYGISIYWLVLRFLGILIIATYNPYLTPKYNPQNTANNQGFGSPLLPLTCGWSFLLLQRIILLHTEFLMACRFKWKTSRDQRLDVGLTGAGNEAWNKLGAYTAS